MAKLCLRQLHILSAYHEYSEQERERKKRGHNTKRAENNKHFLYSGVTQRDCQKNTIYCS
jgi:hypothetical protein